MYRSHYCTELTKEDIGKQIILSGWVHKRRDHGELIFIDLRDRSGLVQIVFDPKFSKISWEKAEKIRHEYVIKVEGMVRDRADGGVNPNLKTGDIEVEVNDLDVISVAKTTPFEVNIKSDLYKNVTSEDLRLKYRYLDLRREKMKSNIELRYKVIKSIRDFLDSNNFWEIETPILVKGTPEGAREYLVPSRLYPGNFYVLPQSPQQMKQLLMVAGMDRYFQIARCFRDEDQRGDRQPEFTQLDLEMSFVEESEIMQITEQLIIMLTEKHVPHKKILKKPFPILDYDEAMQKYGSDRPDLRFDLEIKDVTDLLRNSDFNVFKSAEVIRALKVTNGATFSRKDIDNLTSLARVYKAKGLAYMVIEDEIKSPILKFLTKGEDVAIIKYLEAKKGDIIFFVADKEKITSLALGAVRLKVAEMLNLIDNDLFAFCWVKNFPLFEKDDETGELASMHHPFTRPKDEDFNKLSTEPWNVKSVAYDVVLNGSEIAGGSVRIHESELQERIFKALNLSVDTVQLKFGHLLEAFSYGAPPHGGIAFGLDRLIMLFADEENIREVIAFPKDGKAKDLMFGAPSPIPEEQVIEANIQILKK
jgi:aspartyl-tRNA synthetase